MSVSRRMILKGRRRPAFAGGANSACRRWHRPQRPANARGNPADPVRPRQWRSRALWITTLWRMESNGVRRERMSAINFTDPIARADDKLAQPNSFLDRGSASRTG